MIAVASRYGEPDPYVWPVPQFPCDCTTGPYMHPKGTFCLRCRCDGVTTPCTLTADSLIWIDDYGTNSPQGTRMRCHFDGRPDEIITDGRPSWVGGHG